MNAQPLWDWMTERQSIYLRRKAGQKWPWSKDPIFQEYRFCNVFREQDTVTQWIDENIRTPYANHPNLWFMLAIARQINWPDTLSALMEAGEWPTEVWDPRLAADVLTARKSWGEKVYTGAYMIQAESSPREPYYDDKSMYITAVVLGNLWKARKQFDTVCHEGASLQDVHWWLTKFRGWGPFMAYEVVTDLRHTRYLDAAPDIMKWANAGPGAIRGLNRLWGEFVDKGSLADHQALDRMQWLLHLANHGTVLDSDIFPDAFEMRDIEHSLCEVDKYLRVKNGEGRPRAKYRPPLELVASLTHEGTV